MALSPMLDICYYVCIGVWVHSHVEIKGQHRMSSPPTFLRCVVYVYPSLVSAARM